MKDQYYTNGEVAVPNSKYYRAIKEEHIFDPLIILIKKGHKDKEVTSSSWGIEIEQIQLTEYLDLPAFFNNSNL